MESASSQPADHRSQAAASSLHPNDQPDPQFQLRATGNVWLRRVDRFCQQQGDRLTPILVKETRQALKSRQFLITFSLLLFAALAWTILGSLSMMPAIYDSPSAPRMLIGYYIVLAIPMLIVVPLAAFRSMEGEIEDGTLELLSITALSPWQIVLGKLCSAALQMLLYFVALFPCVAYAYTLRGVDLPTLATIVGMLGFSGMLLTIIGLFFAPLSQARAGRVVTLLALLAILLLAEWGLATLAIVMILYGNPLSVTEMFFAMIASVMIATSLGHLLLVATAAQLTPEIENRSTHLRVSLLILTAIVLGMSTLAMEMLDWNGVPVALAMFFGLAVLWTLAGSMMVAESSVVTPRVRRQLPSSFLARLMLTWLTPGPTTGLVFCTVSICVVAVWTIATFEAYSGTFVNSFAFSAGLRILNKICVASAVYLIGMLVVVRWIIWVVRINNRTRVELGLAALTAVAVLSSLLPYSIGLYLNDYRQYEYSVWQMTNWVWTLGLIAVVPRAFTNVWLLAIPVAIAFFLTVLSAPQLAFPRRIATPRRVLEEQRKATTQSG